MSGLRVVPTRRHGGERYHVLAPDGRNLAWYDRATARVHLLRQDQPDAMHALSPHRAQAQVAPLRGRAPGTPRARSPKLSAPLEQGGPP